MPNRSLAALFFARVSVLAAANAHAQSLLSDKKHITGFAARKMIETCLAQAARDRYAIALAVVDSAGYLVSYQSTDGATGNYGCDLAVEREDLRQVSPRNGRALRAQEQTDQPRPGVDGRFCPAGWVPIFIGNEMVGAMAEASGTRMTNAPKPRSNPYSPMPPRLERLNGTAR